MSRLVSSPSAGMIQLRNERRTLAAFGLPDVERSLCTTGVPRCRLGIL
jgi:hypothetical protein